MLIGGFSPYSKVVTLSYKFLQHFRLEFFSKFLVIYFTVKVTTDWWNFLYNAKSGKLHSPKKQHFPSVLFHYNVWGCFLPPFWSHRE